MHVSLDQALGRQPRLNRVGQSLLNIGSGASAAYSLRSLTGGDPKVVNVRRSGDTDGTTNEREFTSIEVGNELADWVNGKQETTLPTDVASAAAAYSLRKVRSAYTGNAVQIRRASDNVEVDVAFDANGEVSTSSAITDITEETTGSSQGSTTATTFGAFLTEDTIVYSTDYSSGTDSWTFSGGSVAAPESIGGESNALKVTRSGSGFFSPQRTGVLVDGKTYSISVKLYVPSSNTNSNLSFNVREAGGGTIVDCNVSQADVWESFTVSLTSGVGNQVLQVTSDVSMSDGDVLYIKDVVVTQTTDNDASVVTWYDQSGNGNDATQTTAGDQPVIASSGNLKTRGTNGKATIEFGSLADDHLEVSSRPVAKSVFSVLEAIDTNFQTLITDTNNNSPRITSNNAANNRAYVFIGLGTPSVNVNGGTYNGTSSVSSFGFHLLGLASGTGSEIDRIGANPSTSATSASMEFVSELIIYSSDQSNNRFKIESNINNHYGIYTAAEDGFVETWFDQSGNGKNAAQTTEADQPKIVENGTVKDHLLFTASNTESFDISSAGSIFRNKAFGYLTAVVQHTDSSSGTEPYFYASEGGTSGSARVQFGQRGSNIEILAKPDDDQTFGNSTRAASTDKLLLTGVIKFAADSIQLFSNGTAHTAGTFPAAQNTDDDDSLAVRIGRSSTNYMDGKIYELVVYNTDKSGIRSEIETNIADEYNITLS
jgi:hypothetical protein